MEKKIETPSDLLDARFHWIGNTYAKPLKSDADVTINKVKWTGAKNPDGKEKAYSFIFRNKVWEKMGNNLMIAIDKNRVMFREATNDIVGMRLNGKSVGDKSHKNSDGSRYGRLKATEETKELDNFIGDYDLKFNDFFGIYYIEKRGEKNGEV